ncbi:hypothetical protein FGA82_02010 [Pseudomonas fluorescens]|nr:hypothetical protein FGA82_02010 [Pseudomonas fluorescens]
MECRQFTAFDQAKHNPCGSELARESGVSDTSMSTDPTPSRASSLPHGHCSIHRTLSGVRQ